jgi:hypothetical protein
VYARTERLLFWIWRSNALPEQYKEQPTLTTYKAEADFARRALTKLPVASYPQEAGLVAYNLGRIFELTREGPLQEALEYYCLGIWLLHHTLEGDRRVFTPPRFIPYQREYWHCVASAIHLALLLNRHDLAKCLAQLTKLHRLPLSRYPQLAYLEFLPEPALFDRVSAQAGLGSIAPEQISGRPHIPPSFAELGKCLGVHEAVLEMYRSNDGLLLMLFDQQGGRSNHIGIEQFYWKTQVGNTFRLIEPDDIDFVLDEDEVAWTLE